MVTPATSDLVSTPVESAVSSSSRLANVLRRGLVLITCVAACGIATPDDEADVATDVADTHEDAVDTTPTDAVDIAVDIVDVEASDSIDEASDVDAAVDPMDDTALLDASGVDAEHDVGDLDADADTDPWACERAERTHFWTGAGACDCDGSIPTCCQSLHDDYSPYAVCATGRGEPGEWRVVGDFRDDRFSPCIDLDPDYPQCPW
jgi:hypothetical protein